jgi:hypothetical protein
MEQHAMRIGDPQALTVETRRRGHHSAACGGHIMGDLLQPIGAQRDMMQALAGKAAQQRDAGLWLADAAQLGTVAVLRDGQTGIGVKAMPSCTEGTSRAKDKGPITGMSGSLSAI